MEGLVDGVLPADAVTFLEAQRLTDEMRELSATEAGAIPLRREPTNTRGSFNWQQHTCVPSGIPIVICAIAESHPPVVLSLNRPGLPPQERPHNRGEQTEYRDPEHHPHGCRPPEPRRW